MKKVYSVFATILLAASVFAQAPEKIGYQAVIRDNNGNLINNQTIGMQVSILKDSAAGVAVYLETHSPTTNANGLVSIEIGTGSIVSGNFALIDWGGGTFFIKTETDPTGGTNYTITGTSQLLSVPYALHAKTASSIEVRNLGSYFYLGQDTLGGIVFHVYIGEDGKQHGLIVAKEERRHRLWTDPVFNPADTLRNLNASSLWDGASNSSKMTTSPIKAYLDSLGPGWYLPAINELSLLFENKYHFNRSLEKGNHTQILQSLGNHYWSSTEYYGNPSVSAYRMDFMSGNITWVPKNNPANIRAIKAF